MLNFKALALTVQKLLARLKFQRGHSDRQKKNNMPPDLGSRVHKNSMQVTLVNNIINPSQEYEALLINEAKMTPPDTYQSKTGNASLNQQDLSCKSVLIFS